MKQTIYLLASRQQWNGEKLTDVHTECGYFTKVSECQELANKKNKEFENVPADERPYFFVRTVQANKN